MCLCVICVCVCHSVFMYVHCICVVVCLCLCMSYYVIVFHRVSLCVIVRHRVSLCVFVFHCVYYVSVCVILCLCMFIVYELLWVSVVVCLCLCMSYYVIVFHRVSLCMWLNICDRNLFVYVCSFVSFVGFLIMSLFHGVFIVYYRLIVTIIQYIIAFMTVYMVFFAHNKT